MRILIDECIDPRSAELLIGHDVKTVHEMSWDRLPDGPLLRLAGELFDVFLTIDRNLQYQQNLSKLNIGIVVIRVPKNQLRYYREIRDGILAAVTRVLPGQVVNL